MSETGFSPSEWAAIAAAVSTGLAAFAALGSWVTARKTYKFGKYSILKKRELVILAQLIERHSLYEAAKSNVVAMDDDEFTVFFDQMTTEDYSTINLINELKILDEAISSHLTEFNWNKIDQDTAKKIQALKIAQRSVL